MELGRCMSPIGGGRRSWGAVDKIEGVVHGKVPSAVYRERTRGQDRPSPEKRIDATKESIRKRIDEIKRPLKPISMRAWCAQPFVRLPLLGHCADTGALLYSARLKAINEIPALASRGNKLYRTQEKTMRSMHPSRVSIYLFLSLVEENRRQMDAPQSSVSEFPVPELTTPQKDGHDMKHLPLCLSLLVIEIFLMAGLTIAQNAPELPHVPASLPCGIINPHIQYMVTSDVGSNKSGALDRFDLDPNAALEQSAGDGFPYNGQGAATGDVRTLCLLVFPGDERNVFTSLNITTSIMAKSGCCGGLQPGGQAYAQPEWQSSLILPGSDDGGPWTLKAVLNTQVTVDDSSIPKPTGKCIVSIDGNPKGHELDESVASTSFSEQLSAGPHALKFQCPQYGLNIRGAGAVVQRDVAVNQTLYLSVSKPDTASQHKAK
jgi:hypothetical protein